MLCLLPPLAQARFNKNLVAIQLADAGKVIKEIENTSKPYQIKTVVIDPGHGGHDTGCSGSSSHEKHLALAIGLKLQYLLQQKFPGINVIMTRDRDEFIPLHRRAAIANQNKADLFISIHCNYMPGSRATRGTETFVLGLHRAAENLAIAKRENAAILLEEDYEQHYDYDPNSPEGHIMLTMFQSAYLDQSILFAEKAENHLQRSAGRRSRGIKQAGFVVLRETTMPSVLVETGFLSNQNEENFLKTEGGQMKIARSLLEAFAEYKGEVESTGYQPYAEAPRVVASLPGNQADKVNKRPVVPSDTPAPQTQDIFTNTYQTAANSTGQTAAAVPIYFAVQLAASKTPQPTQVARWRNLGYAIEVIEENGLYKYQARNFPDLQAAQQAKNTLKKKGFSDAFLVAYQGGQRISISQATAK